MNFEAVGRILSALFSGTSEAKADSKSGCPASEEPILWAAPMRGAEEHGSASKGGVGLPTEAARGSGKEVESGQEAQEAVETRRKERRRAARAAARQSLPEVRD